MVVVIFRTLYIHLMPLTFASTRAGQAYHLPDLELNRYSGVGIRLQRACIIHKYLVIVPVWSHVAGPPSLRDYSYIAGPRGHRTNHTHIHSKI